jgi:hypothetical protein
MERHPEQAIVGQFSLWIRDVNPNRSYWLLVLTNHGLYDADNPRIQKLVQKYSQSEVFSSMAGIRQMLGAKSRLDVTLDFFLWLYSEDKALCFRLMKDIYEDFQDDEDIPDPYAPVEKLAEFDPSENGHYPDISDEDLVSLSTQVVGEGDEFAFYRYVSDHIAEAEEEVFIVDPYVDKEAIRLYLADTPADVEKRILTDDPQGNFDGVAEKLVKQTDHRIEVRSTPKCHDRLLFVDDRCFLVGISIKDAGRNPNYVVDFESVEHFREPWEALWTEADVYRVFE